MKLSDEDRQRLEALTQTLMELQSDLSLAQLITLLSVALNPGLSVNALAERLGVPQQTASLTAS
jgi:DNA-binding MarR family transcriptional regulator